MTGYLKKVTFVLSMICIIVFASSLPLSAKSLDDLSSRNKQTSGSQNSEGENKAISDYLRGYDPVTQQNMQKAGTMASPIVNALGTLSGFIVMVVSAGIFVVTALDLCYIALPFTRSFLNPQQAGGGGAPMMGGMQGMQGMQGGGGQGQGSGRRWVSDEAVACVSANNPQAQPGGSPMMGGMGGMGGMGMAGSPMGMQGGGAQPAPAKSVIMQYLKKRMFFLIIFAVASVILMSSLLTDCGLNLANLLAKIISKFNGQVANINF